MVDNCLAKGSTVYMEEVDFFALTLGSKQTIQIIVIKHVYRYNHHKVHNITALKQLKDLQVGFKNHCMCSVIDTDCVLFSPAKNNRGRPECKHVTSSLVTSLYRASNLLCYDNKKGHLPFTCLSLIRKYFIRFQINVSPHYFISKVKSCFRF